MGEPGPVLDVMDALAAEATAVAIALGRNITLDERLEAIHSLLPRGGSGKASMLQDVEAQRKTEVEVDRTDPTRAKSRYAGADRRRSGTTTYTGPERRVAA